MATGWAGAKADDLLAHWVYAAFEAFAEWIAGRPVNNLAALGPLAGVIVDAQGRLRDEGPARMHDMLDRLCSVLAVADPLHRVANPPALIIGRARHIFGLDGFPVSAAKAIAARPAAGDSDKTPRNQFLKLLQSSAQQIATDLSGPVTAADLWSAARDVASGVEAPRTNPRKWVQWLTPPRAAPAWTDRLGRVPVSAGATTWPHDAARRLLLELAQQPCRCSMGIQLRRPDESSYGHVVVLDSRVNVDVDAFLATVYSMAARAGLEYLRAGIASGAGLAQRAHHQLHAAGKDPRGLGSAISAQAYLFDHQNGWAKHGLLYRPTPPPRRRVARADHDTTRGVVAAVMQWQLFRVVIERRHQLHLDLQAVADRSALVRAARLPSVLITPAHADDLPDDHSATAGLRRIAEASREIKNKDGRFGVIRQWLRAARGWRPKDGSELIELAVMVEQLDWDLVSPFGREPEARTLRAQVWDTLTAAQSNVDDDAAQVVVNLLRSHAHRGSAVIATKFEHHDEGLTQGREAIIDVSRTWKSRPDHTPPRLAVDLMQQSVLAYSGHWAKLAEQTLCAIDTRTKGPDLAVVLRAALVWGWQAIGWLDAVVAADETLPAARWSGSGRLAVPSWQLQPRSIAVRALVVVKLALLAGLVDQTQLDRARDVLDEHGLEPDFTRLPGAPNSLDLIAPLDLKNLLSSTAPRQLLQSMLDCRAVNTDHRATLLQTALLVRTVIGDSEDMPALVLPNENSSSHPVLGDLPVLWRPTMRSFTPFQPTLLEYAETLDSLEGRWDVGWLHNVPIRGKFLSALGRAHRRPDLSEAIKQMLQRNDTGSSAAIHALTRHSH